MCIRKLKESVIEFFIKISGFIIILFVFLIFLFLLKDTVLLFKDFTFKEFIFGKRWLPISEPPHFGIIPLLLGSLYVTFFATIICVPVGIASALFIAEIAPKFLRNILKSFIEILASIPSVVLGFIGIVWLGPFLKDTLKLNTGMCGLTGSFLLAFMSLPTIISISEDAIISVPKSFKEAAFGLGATRWQTLWRVVLPSASSGIIAAIMLGIDRVIGETMVVMMVTGNAPLVPKSILQPLRTLTATIAGEMGEAISGSEHYFALFAVGLILFIITFIINFLSVLLLNRSKK
ncbi:MAG: phosphate ABC transporter permease subunit PstC [Candidatus Omnitrophica bacterium]|nr:phosphate ABC transporter permease subunit PstC [Candidatus Omnitrophota bacterium]MCM8827273.1 phosphate ABC transporter permease subunit PstC [Candidatus Omnitrophota bacterium]